MTIVPTFNVAQDGINLEAQSEFSPIVATCQIDYHFLEQASPQRLREHIIGEIQQFVQGLQHAVVHTFGPELIEHLTGAFTVAQRLAKERAAERNGQVDAGLPPTDNRGEFQTEE